jgi:hypothetical protein
VRLITPSLAPDKKKRNTVAEACEMDASKSILWEFFDLMP